MGSQRVGHDWATEQQSESFFFFYLYWTGMKSNASKCYIVASVMLGIFEWTASCKKKKKKTMSVFIWSTIEYGFKG